MLLFKTSDEAAQVLTALGIEDEAPIAIRGVHGGRIFVAVVASIVCLAAIGVTIHQQQFTDARLGIIAAAIVLLATCIYVSLNSGFTIRVNATELQIGKRRLPMAEIDRVVVEEMGPCTVKLTSGEEINLMLRVVQSRSPYDSDWSVLKAQHKPGGPKGAYRADVLKARIDKSKKRAAPLLNARSAALAPAHKVSDTAESTAVRARPSENSQSGRNG